MARFEAHCEESIRLFGKPYEEVHRWLDAFAGTKEYGYRHRKKRHHDAGIREVIALFGEAAGPVARQHIITDLQKAERRRTIFLATNRITGRWACFSGVGARCTTVIASITWSSHEAAVMSLVFPSNSLSSNG